MKTNIVCFSSYRIRSVAERTASIGRSKVGREIDTLHNLRLRYDRFRGSRGILARGYYVYAPKYAGGLDRRGRTPTHINLQVDQLRERAPPAEVLNIFCRVRD
jgi:hypothetical protein